MHIWIDESGSFAGLGKMPSPSCVGALVVPDAKIPDMLRLYRRLRLSLPKEKGEVKGRLLTARQVAEVVGLLRRAEALFEISVMELGNYTVEDIQKHQDRFARGFGANITSEHNDAVRNYVSSSIDTLLGLKPPLYVQTLLNFEVLKRTFENATNYFAQRRPVELGNYSWDVDGKEPLTEKTPWEKWWSEMLFPIIQARSIAKPFPRVDGFDYSYLD
jgi:hypothetical protein